MRLSSSVACLVILASPARAADFSPAAKCEDVAATLGTPAMAELTEYIVVQVQQLRAAMPVNGRGPAPDPSYAGFIRRVITACTEAPTMHMHDVVAIEYVNALLVGQPYVGE